MNGRRRLALRRETLTELSTGELSVVNGAADAKTIQPLVCYVVGASQLRCEPVTFTDCMTCVQ